MHILEEYNSLTDGVQRREVLLWSQTVNWILIFSAGSAPEELCLVPVFSSSSLRREDKGIFIFHSFFFFPLRCCCFFFNACLCVASSRVSYLVFLIFEVGQKMMKDLDEVDRRKTTLLFWCSNRQSFLQIARQPHKDVSGFYEDCPRQNCFDLH